MTVDGDGGIGLMRGQHPADGVADLVQRRIVERARRVLRREPGGQEQLVALAQRHLEAFGEVQHHLGARPRAAGLDEAEMPRRDPGLQRQLHLAQPPPLAPVAEEETDPPSCAVSHRHHHERTVAGSNRVSAATAVSVTARAPTLSSNAEAKPCLSAP